jgi:hypothetical protein
MDDERDALVSLEPGQIVLGRNPLGIRRLGRGTVFLLSLLRVYVLVAVPLVIYAFCRALHA